MAQELPKENALCWFLNPYITGLELYKIINEKDTCLRVKFA